MNRPFLLLLLCCLLFLMGCPVHCDKKQTSMIKIDHAEVFTRERLLNERLQEREWLKTQLDATDALTFQGRRDTRTLKAFAAGLKVGINPSSGSAADKLSEQVGTVLDQQTAEKEQGSEIYLRQQEARARYDEELFALEHELNMLKLKSEITLLKTKLAAGELSLTDVERQASSFATGTAAISDESAAQLLKTLGELEDRLKESVPESKYLKRDQLLGVPGAGKPEKTDAELTSIELLREKIAFRDFVRAAMNEKALDDIHDRNGMSLYTLKFDFTVTPGQNIDQLAKLKLNLLPPGERKYLSNVSILRAVERTVRTDAIRLQKNGTDFVLPPDSLPGYKEPTVPPHSASNQFKGLQFYPFYQQVMPQTSTAPQKRSQPAAATSQEDRNQSLCTFIQDKYTAAFADSPLADLINFSKPIADTRHQPPIYVPTLQKTDKGRNQTAYQNPYVYNVEPKEHAQNISDISAAENLFSLLAGVSALIPSSGVGLDSQVEYQAQSLELLNTIDRKPLVVGFINGASEFGWILGPRFTIKREGKKATVDFAHSVQQYSFQVQIVAPADWTELRLTAAYSLLNEDGTEGSELAILDGSEGSPLTGFAIPLPASADGYVASLLRTDQELAKPKIHDVLHNEILIGQEDAYLLIRGENLWRNPEVYLGSYKSREVSIMPNMDGIIAKISIPAMAAKFTSPLPLSVLTSEGIDTWSDIALTSSESVKAQEGAVSLKHTILYNKGKLVFSYDGGKVPDSYYALSLQLRKIGADGTTGPWRTGAATLADHSLADGSGTLTFETDGGNWTKNLEGGGLYELDLRLQKQNRPVFHHFFSNRNQPVAVAVFTDNTLLKIDANHSDPLTSGILRLSPINSQIVDHAFPGIFQGQKVSSIFLKTTPATGGKPYECILDKDQFSFITDGDNQQAVKLQIPPTGDSTHDCARMWQTTTPPYQLDVTLITDEQSRVKAETAHIGKLARK